ncbi:hypothetical protein OBV_18650 [Oscillibacter valericigenes Sjm18-20]|nr:hypothetical protein OBV_18650 [Oscillibacter valericigenes Sjm18-20]
MPQTFPPPFGACIHHSLFFNENNEAQKNMSAMINYFYYSRSVLLLQLGYFTFIEMGGG